MDLEDLGFDNWFQGKSGDLKGPGLSVARVTRVDRDRYLVRDEKSEVQAELTGRLLFRADSGSDLPCVGDWVLVQYFNDGTLAIIHELLPRKTFLRRKSPGKKIDHQMIAANVDAAFIMQSCDFDFNLRRMERYLVMVNEGHVEPVILLSKSDLVSPEDLARRIASVGEAGIDARVIALSTKTATGLNMVRRALEPRKTYCLLGSSGVGKSTLLNHLLGREECETNPVREKDGRGRHTTARRQLSLLDQGALLIDTPGLRELGMIAEAKNVEGSFPDIHSLSSACRFKDCTHTMEDGCAVLQAMGDGRLTEERYRSFLKLTREAEFHQMSYAERRKKDKRFGRSINIAMRQLHKRKPSA